MHIASQSALLADPKATAFRYPSSHHSAAKQFTGLFCFTPRAFPRFDPSQILLSNKKRPQNGLFCLMARLIGIEPTATRRRRPVLYPLSYKRIILKVRCGKRRTLIFVIYSKKSFFSQPLFRNSFCPPGKCRKHTADRKT